MTITSQSACGHAMYLEFIKAPSTTQVLIMPEGMTSAHSKAFTSVYRRRLSPVQPRKVWTHAQMGHMTPDVRTALGPEASSLDIATQVFANAAPLFHGLAINNWILYKDPIVVEVTQEDLEDSRLGKTPYKVFGRVWKVRKAMGFPKEFIHAAAAPSF